MRMPGVAGDQVAVAEGGGDLDAADLADGEKGGGLHLDRPDTGGAVVAQLCDRLPVRRVDAPRRAPFVGREL